MPIIISFFFLQKHKSNINIEGRCINIVTSISIRWLPLSVINFLPEFLPEFIAKHLFLRFLLFFVAVVICTQLSRLIGIHIYLMLWIKRVFVLCTTIIHLATTRCQTRSLKIAPGKIYTLHNQGVRNWRQMPPPLNLLKNKVKKGKNFIKYWYPDFLIRPCTQ